MKDNFEFSITNHVDEEIEIPVLLVQPFIENAMHHGLLNKEGYKKLTEFTCTSANSITVNTYFPLVSILILFLALHHYQYVP